MKKFYLLIVVLIFGFCSKPAKKSYEIKNSDGVKIVKNYSFLQKGKNRINLKKEFEININNDLINENFSDFGPFEVSDTGEIYFFSKKEGLFVFDNNGKFVKNFCKIGRGPREIGGLASFFFNNKGQLVVCDNVNMKVLYFDNKGNFLKEIKSGIFNSFYFRILNNGNYIKEEDSVDKKKLVAKYILYSKDNKILKILTTKKIINPFTAGEKIPAVYNNAGVMIGNSKLYAFSQENGYEIDVYDFNGKLIEKIERLNYKKIKPDEKYVKDFKSFFKKGFMKEIKNKFYFPKYLPPFHTMFISYEGYIFVQTYERDKISGDYIYEIYNRDGILLLKAPLPVYSTKDSSYQKVKGNKLYTKRYDKDGNEIFIVYKISGV